VKQFGLCLSHPSSKCTLYLWTILYYTRAPFSRNIIILFFSLSLSELPLHSSIHPITHRSQAKPNQATSVPRRPCFYVHIVLASCLVRNWGKERGISPPAAPLKVVNIAPSQAPGATHTCKSNQSNLLQYSFVAVCPSFRYEAYGRHQIAGLWGVFI
jgi:hypothetical protein